MKRILAVWLCAFVLAMAFFVTRTCKATTVDVRVASSTGDVMDDGTEYFVTVSPMELTNPQRHGYRFIVSIPSGVTIDTAFFRCTTNEVTSGAVDMLISMELSTAPANFNATEGTGAGHSAFVTRFANKTSTTTTWSIASGDQWSTTVTDGKVSPNFASTFQQIANLGALTNVVVFIYYSSGAGNRNIYSYNGSTTQCASLHLVYTAGAGGSTVPARRRIILQSALERHFPVWGQWEATCAQ